MCLGIALAQAPEGAPTKKLRFRRPRPNLKDVNNPEGEEAGLPIPLRRFPGGRFNFKISFDIFILKKVFLK